ncbi:ArsR family transcriptional regulator [Halorubrum sp. CBA1125]|uniref:ArsR family transcriptional regulator n=1 Tax=Halorubrum sp. CBA1125 TaxID=2668072 RepID=UPI0012E96B0D|nr:ArsR family transcriptional regulator [Halorubrum sp. CBA1125]MUW13821.1 ArsR family transcriptional regulator [Halorubrum sp. CBA1125]
MRPDAAQPDATGGPRGDPDEFDTWTALQKSTDTTRANLIADIVGHPKGAPSVKELSYMNPDLTEDAIRRHLYELRDVGVIAEIEIEPGNRVRGYPYKFYRLTTPAKELFDRNDLFPEDAWKRQYSRVEKTGEIRELEEMPRPDSPTHR